MAALRMIREEGLPYDMTTAKTLSEASAFLEKNRYDIVLLDYSLPDGTGLNLLQGIRETPVVFVTGSGDAGVAVQAMKGGAYDYLIKDPEMRYLKLLPSAIEKVTRIFLLEREHQKDSEQIRILNTELSRMYDEARALSLQDPLTGLANRRMLDIDLKKGIARVKRSGGYLSVLMIDIDYFKKYNDTHGHPAGDRLLAAIAKLLSGTVRETDLVARYGGEEFFVLLHDTDFDGAHNTSERILKLVPQKLGITVSIGVVSYKQEEKMEELINRVDAALYQAKQKGKNRVETG